MKIYILFAFFLMMATSMYCQSTKNDQPLTSDYYLQKSKNQRALAYTFLGVGAAAFAIPVIIYASDPYFNAADIISPAGPLSILAGIGLMVASVPVFYAAGNNKRKGMSLSFKNETAPYIQNGSILSKSVPSLSLKIGL